MPKRLNWEEIVKRSSEIHKSKYEYKFQYFKNGKDKIDILCPIHGTFKQSIESHLTGKGCPNCAGNVKYTKDSLIEKLSSLYGDTFEYNIDGFKNNESIIEIKCKKHGWFRMKISNHLHGQKCTRCSHSCYTNDDFKRICGERHNNYYDYSLVEYETYQSTIKVICPNHGIFEQNARTHFRGSGCSECEGSKGERGIKLFLEKNKILFESQKKFDGCIFKKHLPFDFYLNDFNVCIEFDGLHHYQPIRYFGGVDNFEKQKIRDNIKDNFCKERGIKLLRISYKDNIEKKLNEFLNEFSL